jgi:hypothetical protein
MMRAEAVSPDIASANIFDTFRVANLACDVGSLLAC